MFFFSYRMIAFITAINITNIRLSCSIHCVIDLLLDEVAVLGLLQHQQGLHLALMKLLRLSRPSAAAAPQFYHQYPPSLATMPSTVNNSVICVEKHLQAKLP